MVIPIYAGLGRVPNSRLEASGDLGAKAGNALPASGATTPTALSAGNRPRAPVERRGLARILAGCTCERVCTSRST
jgi:hypothetical protein